MTTSFSILNSGVVYFTTVVVYTWEKQIWGVWACVRRRSNFITSGEEHTRRSENECNSLKDANKQRSRLLHPETHKHEFPSPVSELLLPKNSYSSPPPPDLILHFLGSIIINSAAAAVPYTCSFAYITPVGIHNFSDIGLTTRYTCIYSAPPP